MRELTETELQTIKELKENDVLQPLRGFQLDYSNGVIMVACADGDQMYDLFTTHASLCPCNPNRHRIHLLTRNDGALLAIGASSPGGDIFHEVKEAHIMKHINAVALYTHVPCGVADKLTIGIMGSLSLPLGGKHLIEETIPPVQVACFFHVDYGQGKKRSYHVSPEKFDEWVKSKKK